MVLVPEAVNPETPEDGVAFHEIVVPVTLDVRLTSVVV